MSPILLSSEQPDDDLALASRLANRIACYRVYGDALDPDSLKVALRRDGFSELEVGRALKLALAALAEAT